MMIRLVIATGVYAAKAYLHEKGIITDGVNEVLNACIPGFFVI